MSKQRFSEIERMAFWEVGGEKCAYTGHPIDLDVMHLDHILPESLKDKPDQFRAAREQFNLPDDFNLLGYENVLPSKSSVNLTKGDGIYDYSVPLRLDQARERAQKVRESVEKRSLDRNSSKARTTLKGLLSRDVLSVQEVVQASQKRALDLVEEGSLDADAVQSLLEQFSRELAAASGSAAVPLEQSSGSTQIDKRIDIIRDMITGQSERAHKLLTQLWAELPHNAEPRLRFRVRANIAASLLRMGRIGEAAQGYIEAFNEAPQYEKAAAFKVLGLALSGNADDAVIFGTSAANSIDDAGLSSARYVAAKLSSKKEDPTCTIPESHFKRCDVNISRIDFLRVIDEVAWRDAARATAEKFPEDNDALRFAADATLDDIFTAGSERTYVLSAGDSETVRSVTASLQTIWDEEKTKEGKPDLTIAANLCNAYRLLGDFENAKRAAQEALSLDPTDTLLQERLLGVALDSNDDKVIQNLLNTAPITRDLAIGAAVFFSNQQQWQQFIEFAELVPAELLNGNDLAVFNALILVARIKMGEEPNPIDAIGKFLEVSPDSAAAMTVLCQIAAEFDEKTAAALFQGAFERRNQLNAPERIMLAHVAARRNDFEVVKILLLWIPKDTDTEELRLFCLANVNSRATAESIEFARELGRTFGNHPYFTRVVGSLFYNGGFLTEAEDALKRAIALDKTNAQAHIALTSTFIRRDMESQARMHLASIDLSSLVGSPYQKVGIAQWLIKFGRTADAMEFAYSVTRDNLNDPSVVQLYAGILLMNPDEELIPDFGNVIGKNVWVEYRTNSRTDSMTIEGDIDLPDEKIYSVSHPFSRAFQAKTVGDTVTWQVGIGSTRNFQIIAIKHKYLALLHEIMATFNTKFPSETGFTEFEVSDGNFEPIFDVIKRQSARKTRILELYANGPAPLTMVRGVSGGSIVELARQLAANGFDIRACIGTHEERAKAIDLVHSAREKGIVFDTHTVWAAFEIGILPLLREKYKRLIISQASIDELIAWREDYAGKARPTSIISYEAGGFVRREFTAEEIKAHIDWIESGIQTIVSNCEIIPAVADANFADVNREILDVIDESSLHPAFIASTEDVLLLSDDVKFREMCLQLKAIEGSWLQAVLLHLLASEAIDIATYAHAIVKLAQFRHTFLTLNAAVLQAAIRNDPTLGDFSILMEFIGADGADLNSHLNVVCEFIAGANELGLPELNAKRAVSKALERGLYLAKKHGQLAEAISMVERRIPPEFRLHFEGWKVGHFIYLEPVQIRSDQQRNGSRESARKRKAKSKRRHGRQNRRP